MTPTFLTPALAHLLFTIEKAGGYPLVVGGCVRDELLRAHGKTTAASKDVDIEVYRMPLAALEATLEAAKVKVDAVGRSFGVLKVQLDGECFDVSLPRRESKAGTGHRGFVVESDPNMSVADASSRRDLTINAMSWDFMTGEILDPHQGQVDLMAGVLRHVSPAFAEDPLRVMRVCQFAARFGFTIAAETVELCRSLVPEMATLPVERFWEEWKKLLLKSTTPSIGLYAMVETGAIDLFPELKALIGVNQDPEWHPEGQDHPLGSLWVHNCMVTDAAARVIRDDEIEDEDERLTVMLGALCHDLGKPATTVWQEGKGGFRWRAHAHEEAGAEPTRSFLTRIGAPPAVIDAVIPCVEHHLKPFMFARDRASDSSIRRLALKVPLVRLTRVARADCMGRTTPDALAITDSREIEDIKWLLGRAENLKVAQDGPKPLLMGRHLIALGMKPGKEMGQILKAAFEVQLEGGITDEETAIAWAKGAVGGVQP